MALERAGPTSFGQRLRQLRIAAGLTQQTLADRSRVSVDAISAYENGRRRRPHPETLSMLADGLDLGPAERRLLVATARTESRPRRAHSPERLPGRAAVFLSHTADLRAYPAGRSFVAAAEAAAIRAGHAVSDMAYFPAHDSEPGDYCTNMVATADVYVAIVGQRYGLPVRGRPEISYTELEFEVATARGMPRLIFLVRDDAQPPGTADQPEEHRARQQAFRQRLLDAGVTIVWVDSPAEMEIGLYHALVQLWAAGSGSRSRPAPGPAAASIRRRLRHPVAAHVRRLRLPALAAAAMLLVAGTWTAVPRMERANGWPATFGLVRFVGSQAHLASESLAMKQRVLAGFKGIVDFDSQATGATVVQAIVTSQAAGVSTIDLLDMIDGEMLSLKNASALQDLTPLLRQLEKDRAFPPELLQAGRLGTSAQYYIPWLEATYLLVINKQALPFKPPDADVQHLTYDQLVDWGQRLLNGTGQKLIGLPAEMGDPTNGNGLMYRFLQGYLYPSFTGTTLTGFRSQAAVSMWEELRSLWAVVNPESIGYTSMQQPLQSGDVWIAWDHQARLKDALDAAADQYLVVPAPRGPRGLGHMTALVGLAIPKGAPNQAGAEALIDWLTQPAHQAAASASLSFFPAVEHVGLAGPQAVEEHAADLYLHDVMGVGTIPPAGLGAESDEFTKVYQDAFKRIVLKNEDVQSVLDFEASRLQTIIDNARAPCWPPDQPSDGRPCHIIGTGSAPGS